MVWVRKLEASMAEGWVSQWCVDPAWPERRGSSCVWVWCRAMAWHSPRSRDPSRTEQWLCRSMGWRFGRLAVLLLDHGMEKPSMI
jgi:hypothetical protein